MQYRCVLPALLAAVLTPQTTLAAKVEKTQVFLSNGELNYVGELSIEANAKVFALYKKLKEKPTTLSINSPGGNTDVGMALGKWVYQNKLDVKVLEGCYSSCANYVFPAARHKTVSNFAVIGYHGGLSSMSFNIDDASIAHLGAAQKDGQKVTRESVMEIIRKAIAPQLEREAKYFEAIGVQQRITTLGQDEKYKKAAPEGVVGWYYDIEDFAKLGVSNITVINPPWQPKMLGTEKTVYKLTLE